MLLPEPVHSEVMARKVRLKHVDVLKKIPQPLAFYAGVGVHDIFRYAGTQQPFLLGRGRCGEGVQVSLEGFLKFGMGHGTILSRANPANHPHKSYGRQCLIAGRWQKGQKE